MCTSDSDASSTCDGLSSQRMRQEETVAAHKKMLDDFYAKLHADKAAEPDAHAAACSAEALARFETLGEGAEASVLLVEHEGGTFAYKEYICVNAGDANALAGVAQEANAEFKSLSEVYHGADITVSPAGNEQRNVIKPVRLVTVPSNGNHVSGFLMEPLDGQCLLQNLSVSAAWTDASATQSPLSLRAAACIALQACRGAAAFHRAGFAHLDIKPNNLILRSPLGDLNDFTPDSELLLVDGGLASAGGGALQRRMRCSLIRGTPGFMAPEQLCESPQANYFPSPAIDAVALGRTLLCLYTTGMPTQELTNEAIIDSIRDGSLMATLYPHTSLLAPAAFINVALWLANADACNRLSVDDAICVFHYMHDRAEAGQDVTPADLRAAFGLGPHPLLPLYPTTDGGAPGFPPAEPEAALTTNEASVSTAESGEHEDDGVPAFREAATARVSGPSFAELHHDEGVDFYDMAAALQRASGAGEPVTRATSRKHCYAAVPEIEFAEARTTGPLSGTASAVAGARAADEEVVHECGGSPRIAAFGERVTVHSCAAPEDAAGRVSGVSVKALVPAEVDAAVSGGEAKRGTGKLRRMRTLWAASMGRLSAAVRCRGIAVQA